MLKRLPVYVIDSRNLKKCLPCDKFTVSAILKARIYCRYNSRISAIEAHRRLIGESFREIELLMKRQDCHFPAFYNNVSSDLKFEDKFGDNFQKKNAFVYLPLRTGKTRLGPEKDL